MAQAVEPNALPGHAPWAAVVVVAGALLLAAAIALLLGSAGAGTPALGLLTLATGAGLIAGSLAVRILMRRLRAAERLSGQAHDALGLVADWYWEQDREFRFTVVSMRAP